MHLLGLCLFLLLLTPGAQPDVLGSGAPHPVTCVLGTCLCAQGWPQDDVSGLLCWEKKKSSEEWGEGGSWLWLRCDELQAQL